MLYKQVPTSTEHYSLLDNDIEVRVLNARTAIRVGKKSGCYSDSKAAAQACCDALENATDKFINLSVKGEWYCKYSDAGTGDWD